MLLAPSPASSRAERRAKVLALIRSGVALTQAAKAHNLSTGTVHYWVANPRLAKPEGDRRYAFDWDALRAMVRACPERTVGEHARHFGVSYNAVWKALKAMGLRCGAATATPKNRKTSRRARRKS